MTSEGLGKMFESNWAEQFLIMLTGGQANGQVCPDGEFTHKTIVKRKFPFDHGPSHDTHRGSSLFVL
jgi:hypothetical protein